MATVLEILSPQNRKVAYVVYEVISGLIGASLAGYAAIDTAAPVGFVFASAFVNFIGVAFGVLAAGNVTNNETPATTDTPE